MTPLIAIAVHVALASSAAAATEPGTDPIPADAATTAAAAARERLGFLIGNWTVEGKEDTFTETCEWFHERSHIVCNSVNATPQKTTRGVSVFSYVPQTGRHAYYHYGSSGVSAAMDVFPTERGLIATHEREVGGDLVREHVRIESRPDGSFDFVEDDSVNGGPWTTVAKVHYIRKGAAAPAASASPKDDCKWPDALDAVAAAPRNHKLLLENDEVRVLDVTVAPGEREAVHAHCNRSVMHITQAGPYRDYDADGRLIEEAGAPPAGTLPMTLWLEPQPPHAVHNLDTKPMRLLRVELKAR